MARIKLKDLNTPVNAFRLAMARQGIRGLIRDIKKTAAIGHRYLDLVSDSPKALSAYAYRDLFAKRGITLHTHKKDNRSTCYYLTW